MNEFEVEIDGVVFKVKQVQPEDGGDYTEKEAELVARACLLFEDEAEKMAFSDKPKTDISKNPEEPSETVREIFHEKITEKYVTRQPDELQRSVRETAQSQLSVNYRRQVEELSRYLSRDSRRYDGYFEMY